MEQWKQNSWLAADCAKDKTKLTNETALAGRVSQFPPSVALPGVEMLCNLFLSCLVGYNMLRGEFLNFPTFSIESEFEVLWPHVQYFHERPIMSNTGYSLTLSLN